MRRYRTPLQRLTRAVHIIVLLAIFYAALNIVALLGNQKLAQYEYGWVGLGSALVMLALGIGVRYGLLLCLYGLVGLFASASLIMFRLFVDTGEAGPLLRCTITTWILLILCRAIPAMHSLRRQRAFPLPMQPTNTAPSQEVP